MTAPNLDTPHRPDLLAELLHELDTPLGVALTAASIQQQRLGALLPDTLPVRALADLHEATRLVRQGLDQALAVIAARRGARPASFAATVGLQAVLGDALSVPLFRFRDRRIDCTLDVDADLIVDTEPQAWQQVMTNLVANSAHHGFARAEDAARISVTADRVGRDRVRVVYRDNGRGLSVRARNAAFVRQYSSRAKRGSSGLGLCIVRDIVRDRLHGCIELIDGDGGAAFGIEVPLRAPGAC